RRSIPARLRKRGGEDLARERRVVHRTREHHRADSAGKRRDRLRAASGARAAGHVGGEEVERRIEPARDRAAHAGTVARGVRAERCEEAAVARIVAMALGEVALRERVERTAARALDAIAPSLGGALEHALAGSL